LYSLFLEHFLPLHWHLLKLVRAVLLEAVLLEAVLLEAVLLEAVLLEAVLPVLPVLLLEPQLVLQVLLLLLQQLLLLLLLAKALMLPLPAPLLTLISPLMHLKAPHWGAFYWWFNWHVTQPCPIVISRFYEDLGAAKLFFRGLNFFDGLSNNSSNAGHVQGHRN
jgi:hypothetical protein